MIHLLFYRKDYGIGTLHYNWPMSAHALPAFSTYTSAHDCTDSEHLPFYFISHSQTRFFAGVWGYSVANHVKARQSLIERAVTWLATESGWARNKRFAICSGKLCGGFIIFGQCCPRGTTPHITDHFKTIKWNGTHNQTHHNQEKMTKCKCESYWH